MRAFLREQPPPWLWMLKNMIKNKQSTLENNKVECLGTLEINLLSDVIPFESNFDLFTRIFICKTIFNIYRINISTIHHIHQLWTYWQQHVSEVSCPKTIGDIVDFFLREIIKRELTFKQCRSCGKYFPAITAHGNSEYCSRLFQDTGKTCKEIGSAKVYQAKVENSPAIQAYNRAYKTHFARIKYKKMTKEDFQAWAELARKFRDEVTAGKMTLQEYEDWLKR